MKVVDLADPVHRAHQDGPRHLAGQADVDPDGLGPVSDDVDGIREPRGVEADFDLHRFEHRAEHRAAADLVLALPFFLLGDLPAVELEAGELRGGSGDDDGAPAVANRQHRRQDRTDVLRELVQQLGDALGIGVGYRHHRRVVTEHGNAAATGHQRARRADQLRQRQQLDVLGALGRERLHRQHAL